MRTHLFLRLALLLPVCGLAIHSQSRTVNCSTDAIAAGSGGCAQAQPSAPFGTSALGTGGSTQRTSSLASENATLGGKDAVLLQQSALPADASAEFQQLVDATIGQPPSIFGANLFHSGPSAFSLGQLAPMTPDYVAGPENELRVRVWRQVGFSDNLRTAPSGGNTHTSWSNSFERLRLNPGNTIDLPEINLHPTAMRNLLE